jgi:integrase
VVSLPAVEVGLQLDERVVRRHVAKLEAVGWLGRAPGMWGEGSVVWLTARGLIGAEPYKLLFELAAETGCRLAEALGLVWGEVNFTDETVTFTSQLDRQGRRAPLKTSRSRRCLEITPTTTSKLRAAKLAAARSGPHDFVFVTRAGTPHDHRNIGGRVLSRAVARAGLDAVKRDGAIIEPAPTYIEEVSARLGHANVATIQRIYVHAYDAARRSSARRDRLTALYAMSVDPSRRQLTPARLGPLGEEQVLDHA